MLFLVTDALLRICLYLALYSNEDEKRRNGLNIIKYEPELGKNTQRQSTVKETRLGQ